MLGEMVLTLSTIIQKHFKSVVDLYPLITPGQNLSPSESRSGYERDLTEEISQARTELKQHIRDIGRPRPVNIAMGGPKGAWAHIYYISFHDLINSNGPTKGFYPCFLVSIDQKSCWLSIIIAAASVGISGRGGWSHRKGNQLLSRADILGHNLIEKEGWKRGPIPLGYNNSFLHKEKGTNYSAGRAYECGVIISRRFNPNNPPNNLADWLTKSFEYFDEIYSLESVYIETSVPRTQESDPKIQINSAITGSKAEKYFIQWVQKYHPEWGIPIDRTDRVGFGYDVEFPAGNIYVEVKGCRGNIDDIRLTEKEWHVAENKGERYVLCIVSNLDGKDNPIINLIKNPYRSLSANISKSTQLQITYNIKSEALKEHSTIDSF